MHPSLRARGNPPAHRRNALLYRRTKLIRREPPKRATIRRVVPRDPHPYTPSPNMRSGRFYNRFTNSPESPRSASSHHPAFTTVYRISHYPPLRLANSSFPKRVLRVPPWGKDTRGTRQDFSQRCSRRNAIIDWIHRDWLWSARKNWYIGTLTMYCIFLSLYIYKIRNM